VLLPTDSAVDQLDPGHSTNVFYRKKKSIFKLSGNEIDFLEKQSGNEVTARMLYYLE
jgi:hypothetical protein